MRSSEELLEIWESATAVNPIILAPDEYDNFCKAMKILSSREDDRLNGGAFKITLQDRDMLLKDGIKSPIDPNQTFTNRKDWGEHLKRHNCFEVGNDLNNAKAPKEMRGDFNVRNELGKATYQVMEKHGH